MDVKQYIPTGANVATLANMEATEIGRILLYAFSAEKERRDRQARRNARINTEKIRDDMRYKFGEVEGLEWLSVLHKAAKDAASGRVGGQRNTEDSDT